MKTSYGSWPSPLTATELTRGVKGFADLQHAAGALFLLESRPEEAGRNTLVMLDPNLPGDSGIELTPAPLNVRSRVHEYGGGAFLATDSAVFFVNFSDQNVFVVDLAPDESTSQDTRSVQPSPPRQLTFGSADRRYADFSLDANYQRLLAVCEQHDTSSHEPQNLLVSIDLESAEELELHAQHDFYASPKVSRTGNQVAFVAWDHPHMPWDKTCLYRADLGTNGLENTAQIEPGSGGQTGDQTAESISQPLWLANGDLLFTSDRSGFWNLHRWCTSGSSCLHADSAEYASPAWIFGQRECVQLANGDLAAVRQAGGLGALYRLSDTPAQGATGTSEQQNSAAGARSQVVATPIHSEFAGYHALCCGSSDSNPNTLWALAEQTGGFSCLIALALDTGIATVLRRAGDFSLPRVSEPEALTVINRSGLETHAWLYLPCPATEQIAEDVSRQTEGLPPLIVLSHGGPTSSTSPSLNPRIQYYTSRGWAVADVNYGGSTGYGRAYRERLRDSWGVIDVHDCEDVALSLAAENRVDRNRLAIKGGSAGGYTTLAALTFGDVFSAGASHYGIGDLDALAAETHKFEARYVDGLIPATEWRTRSPIHSVDKLSCPVIFFQGSDDAVVPPGQAQAMVAALRAKNLPVAYVEFAGEGHGFRQAKNIQHAAAAEYQFFCRVFGIECPDDPVELTIENL